MKPTHSTHKVFLDQDTYAALKVLQSRHPLATTSSVLAQLVSEAAQPITGAAIARQLMEQSGGNYEVAKSLLLEQMHRRYRNFCCNQEPGRREYNRIRKSLNTLKTEK